MVVRSSAAPPTPWSNTLAQPTIHETAYVHSFSNLIGDVRVGPNVLIAPGTSIRADEGSPFYIGAGTNIQDGVVIHGLEQGRVLGDDQAEYSVWIGSNTSITHKVLIHGPAYIGDGCFIGFRSTVFNARIGKGCIVMMHALVQDVEIPPGRYVPSGAIVTSQQQADRLPEVLPEDRQFSNHVVSINEALRSGYQCAEDDVCLTAIRKESSKQASTLSSIQYNASNYSAPQASAPQASAASYQNHSGWGSSMLNSEVLQQIRQLLAGGYRIGTEHVDERRFRTNCWTSCAPIQARSESEAVAALAACLTEHQGEYVRLFGIEPKAKQRVGERIIQRPGDQPNATPSTYYPASRLSDRPIDNGRQSSYSSELDGSLAPQVQQQVQQLLNQGYRIATEYANERQYRANAWRSGISLQTGRAGEAIAALESFIAEHTDEYVRLIGVEPKAKRRVAEVLIHQAGKPIPGSQSASSSSFAGSGSFSDTQSTGSQLSAEVMEQIRHLLSQGYRIGMESANPRQYKVNSWRSGTPVQSNRVADGVAALEAFIAEHNDEYVRLIGVDPQAKRRVLEKLVYQPNGNGASAQSQSAPASTPTSFSSSSSSSSFSSFSSSSSVSSNQLTSEVQQQVRQLLNQGHRVGLEYANPRHYKVNSWQSAPAIQSKRDSEVVQAISAFLAEHPNDYVRLIGINPQVKQRVLEMVLHKPQG